MSTKHTPGPWTYERDEILDESGRQLALVGGMHTTSDEDECNGILIAAAPDLLEALRPFANLGEYSEIVDDFAKCLRPHERDGFREAMRRAEALLKTIEPRVDSWSAVAKAEG